MVGWRHHLHAHPEPSLQEVQTAAFVSARLAELGIAHVGGVGGHGIVATISRGAPNRSVGLRADMDALAITETTGLPYASTRPGVMHACGHDGHTASLLGAAALLARDPDWRGTVQLVFQPAEEGYGGARAMLGDGLLERFPMERVFGYHNWPGLAAGRVVLHPGPVMAAGGRVAIRLMGRSGHAGLPHLARDPVLAAAHVLVALQTIVARDVDPADTAVISVCMIDGGHASNQIPDEAVMHGTFRSHRPEVHAQLAAGIERVAVGIAATLGLRAEVTFSTHVSATVNHAAEADLAAAAATDAGIVCGPAMPPSMASEDFGAYLEQRPGAFAWIGNGMAGEGRGGEGTGLHSSGYDYNDAILPVAARWLASVAKRALAE